MCLAGRDQRVAEFRERRPRGGCGATRGEWTEGRRLLFGGVDGAGGGARASVHRPTGRSEHVDASAGEHDQAAHEAGPPPEAAGPCAGGRPQAQ
eukprot:5372770-Prymnesium_polylepis.1